MGVSDFIADQLTVIRNAIMGKKKTVIVKRSKMLEGIVDILKKEEFVENYSIIDDNQQGKIKIYLKWTEDGVPVMEHLDKISTPGRRHYVAAEDIKDVMGGSGVAILSTNKGLLTDKDARGQSVGGELICEIY